MDERQFCMTREGCSLYLSEDVPAHSCVSDHGVEVTEESGDWPQLPLQDGVRGPVLGRGVADPRHPGGEVVLGAEVSTGRGRQCSPGV